MFAVVHRLRHNFLSIQFFIDIEILEFFSHPKDFSFLLQMDDIFFGVNNENILWYFGYTELVSGITLTRSESFPDRITSPLFDGNNAFLFL